MGRPLALLLLLAAIAVAAPGGGPSEIGAEGATLDAGTPLEAGMVALARFKLTPGTMQKLYTAHKIRVVLVTWVIPGVLLVIGVLGLLAGNAEMGRSLGGLVFWLAGVVMWVFTVTAGMMSVKHGVPPFATVPVHIFAAPVVFMVAGALFLLQVDFNYPVRNWILLCLGFPLMITGFAYGMGYMVFTLKGVSTKLKGLGDALGQ